MDPSVSAVKPDPPESVLVKQLEGYSERLFVSWNFPSSWPQYDAFPLVFHIRYRPQGSMYWSEVSKKGGHGVGFNENTTFPHTYVCFG